MDKKYFTPIQATEFLPELRRSLLRLRRSQATLKAAIGRIRKERPDVEIPKDLCDGPIPTDYYKSLVRFSRELERMRTAGALIRDVDSGLVDFLTMKKGREAYLCWREGESAVQYWHEIDSGFRGRRPISSFIDSEDDRAR